jgi:uncharacterized OsmC-like protein
MARGFRLEAVSMQSPDLRSPTPPELAIAALGACVLITHAHGYSARGISITRLSVDVTAGFRCNRHGQGVASPSVFEDVRYAINVDCDGEDEPLKQLTQFVTCFSPNHRAFLDEGDYRLKVEIRSAKGDPQAVERRGDAAQGRGPKADGPAVFANQVRAGLEWEYATQARARMSLKSDLRPLGREHGVTVDQSKQMVGLDSGLNPQELLLAAMVSELVLGIADLAPQRGIEIGALEVGSGGRLDIRGMLNAVPGVPARFHDLHFTVRIATDSDRRAVEALVDEVARSAFGLCSIRTPYGIGVELSRGATQLLQLQSNLAQVQEFLALMAAKNQELMIRKQQAEKGGG